MTTIPDAALRMIREFEGWRPKVYRDPVGIPTIGFGFTKGVTMATPPMTLRQGEARLRDELLHGYLPSLATITGLNDNQKAALLSFVWNVGTGGVAPTTGVGRALRRKDWRGAADALLAWDKAGGRALPGLTRRRHAERALFLEPIESPSAASWLKDDELRWVREWDRGPIPERRKVLAIVMRKRRKALWKAAQPKAKGGDGRGWSYGQRRERYHSLLARSA